MCRGRPRLRGAGIQRAAHGADGATTTVTADEALARLEAGNARFVELPQLCAAELGRQPVQMAKHQMSCATIVCCADSRVPPELLFGATGIGELFVARNAGNTADTAAMGTIEYGSAMLGIPLIVVLGDERCGAVTAACDVVDRQTVFPGSIAPMVAVIVPAAQAVKDRPGDFVDNAVRESASRTARKIATENGLIADLVAQGKVRVRVMAARYDLDEGRFEYF